MPIISPPNATDTRSRLADWLEIKTLLSERGISSSALLLNVLDILEDDDAELDTVDPESGEIMDDAILEEERQRVIDVAFEELEYRRKILGDSYPFTIDAARCKLNRCTDGPITQPGQVVYLFCLLSSAIREHIIEPEHGLKKAELDIANVFQICACLAAGGYLCGDVSSFGFPRATGTNFLTALRHTFLRFGSGSVREDCDIPDGLPISLKDAGIDVIAWRHHPDGMPGKLYLIGQCASGRNWHEKSVLEYIDQLHGAWFTFQPAKHSIPAMFIPFPFHHDIDEKKGSYFDAVKNRFWYEEQKFGIIFDRLRITYFANACMAFSDEHRGRVDGADRFDTVSDWVQSTRKIVGAAST